jgi:hypothetical protein
VEVIDVNRRSSMPLMGTPTGGRKTPIKPTGRRVH